jgi:WD40-like Beta Propeller Repeat
MQNKILRTVFVVSLLMVAVQNVFAASIDPHVHWRTLVTPHFEIFYDSNQKDLANVYGVAAEQAYEILKHRFSEQPAKTYLVINDNTDSSNGFSTFLPYPMIEVYPVLPSSLLTLDYYGNWPFDLLIHEYTHSLTFEPIHGFIKTFQYIFGSIVHPNGILPRWYLEGLAVESESRFSPEGRLKSPRTFAELRAFSEDGMLQRETIDRINETILPEYPYGERPYVFGSILWEHMMQKGPPDIVDILNQRYGRRVPFFINTPVEDIFHLDYQGLLTETYNDIDKNAHEQIAQIQKYSKENNRPFHDLNMEEFSPAVSPDGRMLIFLASSFNRGQIRIIQRTGKESFTTHDSRKLYDTSGTTRMEWLPDSQSFVFDAIDELDPYHSYHALYEFDLKQRKAKRLTNNIRAQDAGVSPSGRRIAFVINEPGRQSLALLDRFTGDWKNLFRAELSERISTPEFITENEIAFTRRSFKGGEHLYLFNLLDQKTKLYYPKEKELRRPKLTKMGLLVATTGSGVENIALADLSSEKLRPLTNTTTEIQTADWDKMAGELIITRYTGKGRKILAMTPPPQSQSTAELPKVGSVIPGEWPSPPELAPISTEEFKDENYNSAKYLLPRYWIPFIYPVFNGVYMQAATSMSDPVGVNTYTASVDYDTITSHGGFGFQYVNSSLPPDIELSYLRSEQWLGVLGITQMDETYIGDLAFYIPGTRLKGMVGYMHDHVDSPFDGFLTRQGPIATLTYSNWDDPRAEGAGTILQIAQEQFVGGGTAPDLVYGRTFVQAVQGWRKGLPSGHRIVLTAKAAVAPNLPFSDVISLGDSSLGANYLVSLSSAQFLFRGYNNGTFVGRRVANWNLEYQFPMSKNYHGWGTFPLFSRGWDGLFFFDGIGVEGAAYDPVQNQNGYYARKLSDVALSTGFEAHWNTTFAYQLPVTAIFGLYFGFDDQARDSIMPFIGLALSDISAITNLREHWFKRTATTNN